MDIFLVSKLAGLLLQPSNIIALLAVAAGAMMFAARARKVARLVAIAATTSYAAIAILPLGDLLLAGLESRFPALEVCAPPNEQSLGGIIVLGGGITPRLAGGKQVDDLNDASDRLRYAAELAKRFSHLPVLVSGGQAFDNGANRTEAAAMADFLTDLGVDRSRIVIEDASRTTAENASISKQLVSAKSWLLVTSAFHMPRSVGSFHKAGVQVRAAPTDWRSSLQVSPLQFSASANLSKFDLATRELIGLAGYWVTGKTDGLLPGSAGCD